MNRKSKALLSFFVAALFIMSLVSLRSNATEQNVSGIIGGFDIEYIDEKTAVDLAEDFSVESRSTQLNISNPIQCFDVNDSGLIAICINGIEKDYIDVFDSSGQFLYGYDLSNHRRHVTIFWKGSTINIYDHEYIRSIDESGKVINTYKVPQNRNNRERERFYRSDERKVNGLSYKLTNGSAFWNAYTKLVVTDTYGNDMVIYDQTLTVYLKVIIILVSFVAIFTYGVIKVTKVLISYFRNNNAVAE